MFAERGMFGKKLPSRLSNLGVIMYKRRGETVCPANSDFRLPLLPKASLRGRLKKKVGGGKSEVGGAKRNFAQVYTDVGTANAEQKV